MARWVPTKIEGSLKQLYDSTPLVFRRLIAFTYWRTLKLEHQVRVWRDYNQYHAAEIKPFQIFWISPSEINYVSTIRFGDRLGPYVKGGDWDRNTQPFEEREVHISFDERFNEGKDWEDTPHYKSKLEKFGDVVNMAQKEKWGNYIREKYGDDLRNLGKVAGIEDGLEKYDKMYNDIRENGYKTQRELRSIEFRLSKPGITANAIPEYDEINVDIARDGTLLWYHGQHRLSLAKILNLEKVPIRIRCRHREWQDKRNRAITDPNSLSEEDKSHFDIP